MSIHTGTIDAVIDLGSNSAKITIARVLDDTTEFVVNKSTMLRLGESVNATGQITPEKQDAVITTLQQYQQLAQQYEASSIIVVATEAVRKAQNCEVFLNAVQQETGLTVHVVSGEIEAALTFLGAASDYQEVTDEGVVDIGGGSTELIIAQQGHIQWLVSLPIGSGWLHDHYLSSDPPASVEIETARTFLSRYLRQLDLPSTPAALIATGSSAKWLLALARQALKIDQESHILSRHDLLGSCGLLSALPAAEIARRYEAPLERARVLLGGALIILSLMDFLQLNEISVSQHGVSEGALLAIKRYGDNWTEHPEVRVDTSRIAQAPDPSNLDKSDKPPTDQDSASGLSTIPDQDQNRKDDASGLPTFAETGHQELQKRSKKFIKWIDPVLQNEDIEAIHDMRVASRYLRATLDAYQSACTQKTFRRVYQEVKQAADLLGRARDTDVMLQNLEQQQVPENEMPGLQWLISHLQSYREQQQPEIAAFFKDFHSQRFQRSVASCIRRGVPNRGKS